MCVGDTLVSSKEEVFAAMASVDHPSAETSDQFLLATKLALPPIHADVMVRPRLVGKVQGAVRGPLTLLTAAAGFGKTTLLSNVLRHDPGSPAWVSLDSSDDDLTRFWSYVFAALEGG